MKYILAILVLLTACSEQDLAPVPEEKAYVTFVSSALSAGANTSGNDYLRIYINGENAQRNYPGHRITYQAPYPAFNTYLPVKPGSNRLQFRDSAGISIAEGAYPLDNGIHHTVLLADSLAHYSILLLKDEFTVNPNKALMRIVNLCPDGGAVNIFADTVLVSTLDFRAATSYLAITPGQNISFTAKKNDGTAQRLARVSAEQVRNGEAYTLLLKGYAAPPDNDLVNKGARLVLYRN